MRVAYDLTPVVSGSTGIARYTSRLAEALREAGTELLPFALGRAAHPPPPGTRHLAVPARAIDAWWRHAPGPDVTWLTGAADVVHATGMLVPRTSRPLVVTVHDLAGLTHPELHPPRHVRQQRVLLRALSRADAILAVSQATAEAVAARLPDPPPIFVAPLAASPLPEARPVPGLPPRYLLTVGESAPRKGLEVALGALARLEPDVHLVMAGPAAGAEDALSRLTRSFGLETRVIRLGRVEDAGLAGLYAGALALCFPSVAEGFGLPVLEAMSAGLPVVASDIPVLHEVGGEAVLYARAGDPDSFSEPLATLAGDPAVRDRLAEAGRARAAGFTWKLTGERTLQAYATAMGHR